jgi:hypothetical protein
MKMKKLSLLVTILVIATLLIVTPVFADRDAPVGDRIGLFFSDSMEFTAGAPFHIRHGWIQSSEDDAIGIFDFALEVDEVFQREDFKMFSAISGDPDLLNRFWVYNFPNGMTGIHTFTGHWFAPCQYAVDELGYPGPCATPNEKVETRTSTLTITFGP